MPGEGRASIYCLSLGCFKNRVDSERIAGDLASAGFEIADEVDGATVCVINTCAFIEDAVKENIEAILDAVELKDAGNLEKVVVFGCLVNRYGVDDLSAEIPEVDAWVGCEDFQALLSVLLPDDRRKKTPAALPQRRSLPSLPKHTRYLKLSEGCANRCSYCKIPDIRGGLRSHTMSFLVAEAELLVSEGAREVCLVAQDLTAYGGDLSDGSNLSGLLDALESALPRDVWLRLLYLQPMNIDKALIRRIANGRQLLSYLDAPIQHASPGILASMNRAMPPDEMANLFALARSIRPDFTLRTTCIVGYPGETARDFDYLLKFLSEVRFDRVGAFTFSPEEGTPASMMPDQVSKRTKKSRLERLMALQEEISSERGASFIGRTMSAIVDGVIEDGMAEGRTFREAPEVDGAVDIVLSKNRTSPPEPGDMLTIIVTDAYGHDMSARETVWRI